MLSLRRSDVTLALAISYMLANIYQAVFDSTEASTVGYIG